MSEVNRLSLDMEYPFQYREDAEGTLCYYSDYAALKAKRDALAAENANLKHLLSMIAETGNANFGRTTLYTPATDAYLNSVRAEGAMACGIHLREWYDYQVEVRAEEFAAKLRKGESS